MNQQSSTPWNSTEISCEFQEASNNAFRYAKDLRKRISQKRGKDSLIERQTCDEHYAKYFFYDFLVGKLFLDSKELFLAELRRMESTGPTYAPDEVFDKCYYRQYWEIYRKEMLRNLTKAEA